MLALEAFSGPRENVLVRRGDGHALRSAELLEVVHRRAPVGRVVVLDEKPRHELAPVARGGERLPLRDFFLAVERSEAIELRIERRSIGDEVAILIQQQGYACRQVGFEGDAT